VGALSRSMGACSRFPAQELTGNFSQVWQRRGMRRSSSRRGHVMRVHNGALRIRPVGGNPGELVGKQWGGELLMHREPRQLQ
jgi:hypothetical protein